MKRNDHARSSVVFEVTMVAPWFTQRQCIALRMHEAFKRDRASNKATKGKGR